jgi:hypothetical protein
MRETISAPGTASIWSWWMSDCSPGMMLKGSQGTARTASSATQLPSCDETGLRRGEGRGWWGRWARCVGRGRGARGAG